jgi:hypothetical protein
MSSKINQFQDDLGELIYGDLEVLGPTYEMYHQRFKLGNQIVEVEHRRRKDNLKVTIWVRSEVKYEKTTSDTTLAVLLIYQKLGY